MPTKYARNILWSNCKSLEKNQEKIRKRKQKKKKRKRDSVDIILPCKKRRGSACFEVVIHSAWITYTYSGVVCMAASRIADEIDATDDVVRSAVLITVQSKAT
jgi:hypothetical protein